MKRSAFIRLLLAAPLAGRTLLAAAPVRGAALDFLLDAQSPDGAWRSTTYGAFRSGHALTPLLIRCLSRVPSADDATAKAASWLIANADTTLRTFPVHNAAFLLEACARLPALDPLRAPARERLLSLQSPLDGGWSYSPLPPINDPKLPQSPMSQSNLSATAIALAGLAAIDSVPDAILDAALHFVRSCQNHDSGEHPFDDGGFFQLAADPARNKAGTAGTDRNGLPRYRSYAAATTDGLAALQLSTNPADKARTAAARTWLTDPLHPVEKPADLTYYTCRNMARLGIRAREVRELLETRRNPAGYWSNPAGEMRENCPLVATALALEALWPQVEGL